MSITPTAAAVSAELDGDRNVLEDSDSENDLALGLERQFAQRGSPVSLSDVDEPLDSNSATSEEADDDDDDDFVPQQKAVKPRRPRSAAVNDSSDSDTATKLKRRKALSIVKGSS